MSLDPTPPSGDPGPLKGHKWYQGSTYRPCCLYTCGLCLQHLCLQLPSIVLLIQSLDKLSTAPARHPGERQTLHFLSLDLPLGRVCSVVSDPLRPHGL